MGPKFWITLGSLLAVLLVVPVLASSTRRSRRTYAAAAAATMLLLPGVAAFASAFLYLTPRQMLINQSGARAGLFGTLIAVDAWLLLALLFRRYGHVARANPSEYELLCKELDSLDERRKALERTKRALGPVREATDHLEVARSVLIRPSCALLDPRPLGLRWAAATGYIALHQRLHRAEEALLEVEDSPARLQAAIDFDRSRIAGSTITGSQELLDRLTIIGGDLDDGESDQAAPALREIRRALNDFRDSRRAGLVRARNNLYGTILFASVVAYLVLDASLVGGVQKRHVFAAIAFYLVGAMMGLFRQLAVAGEADAQSEEDYGLSQVRLIHTPLFAGIAAVGGVVLTAFVPLVTPTPTGRSGTSSTTTSAMSSTSPTGTIQMPPRAATTSTTAAPTATTETSPQESPQQAREVPALEDIFDLNKNALGLVVAAVFGMTPALLMSRLTAAAEKYKDDLRSTRPSQQTTASAGAATRTVRPREEET